MENLAACSLLKECHFRQDCLGENWNLYYISKKGDFEIDFFMIKDEKPKIAVEVKYSDDFPSKNFNLIAKDSSNVKKFN